MIHVLLVSEMNLVGNLIAEVLRDEPDMAVTEVAVSVEEALERASKADVVLVSTSLPDNGALKLTRELADSAPSVKRVVMGLMESEKQILRYVEAGADGYVLRDSSVGELLTRIRAARGEEALISPRIATALMRRTRELARQLSRVQAGSGDLGDLTPREREVLNLVSRGFTNRDIAERLFVAEGTVKNHVHSILGKLEATSRRDAAAYLAVVQ
jgi:DNA-binding NarL/FixJ family response regulator